MRWSFDEESDYIKDDNKPITVSWNLTEDASEEIIVTLIEWDDDMGHNHYTGDELWDMDYELSEDIMSYIENEFLHSEDFWLTKMGYDF